MSTLINRVADRLLAAVAPKTDAAAASCYTTYRFCYCSGRTGYQRKCTVCPGFTTCGSCQPSILC
jgi:hypothetical protein